MLNLLALDTSVQACSVALIQGEKSYSLFEIAERQQAQRVLPMIAQLLAETGLTLKQLDVIAFTSGPGSFTGIRLAASVVQGLAFGLNLPVVSISTLQALAQTAHAKWAATHVLVAENAHGGKLYWGAYQQDSSLLMRPLIPDVCCAPQEISLLEGDEWVAVGRGWQVYERLLINHSIKDIKPVCYPHASEVALLAKDLFLKGQWKPPQDLFPSYLHDENMWKKASLFSEKC